MAFRIKTTVKRNDIPKLIKSMQRNSQQAVRDTVRDIRSDAFDLAAKDTWAMASSIHVVTSDENGYEPAVALAKARRTKREKTQVTTRFAPRRTVTDPLVGEVVCPIEYAIFVEFGTRQAPAQPFMRPAAMMNWRRFVTRMKDVVRF